MRCSASSSVHAPRRSAPNPKPLGTGLRGRGLAITVPGGLPDAKPKRQAYGICGFKCPGSVHCKRQRKGEREANLGVATSTNGTKPIGGAPVPAGRQAPRAPRGCAGMLAGRALRCCGAAGGSRQPRMATAPRVSPPPPTAVVALPPSEASQPSTGKALVVATCFAPRLALVTEEGGRATPPCARPISPRRP